MNDVKHGRGHLKYTDGEQIFGYWCNDRLNGLAKLQPKGSKERYTVIYKNDMQINTRTSNLSCGDCFYVVFSICLMLTFYAAIPVGILIDNSYFGIMGVYLIYIIYSACTGATKYINNLKELPVLMRDV